MKKCNFYCIIDPSKPSLGGGEQTQRYIINNLKETNYKVNIITPIYEFLDPNQSDLNIYADLWNDPNGSRWFSMEQYLALLQSTTPFLISDCAYGSMTTQPYGDSNNNGHLLTNFSRHFFLKAAKVILASPLHLEETEKFLGCSLDQAYLYLREIDTIHFKITPQGINRDIEYLSLNVMNYWKGTDIVISKYGNCGLVIGGYGVKPPVMNGATFIGQVSYNELPQLYSRAKHYVHLPRWKESFSRTVCEAALCGCKIIGNSNIGALSWGLDLSNSQIYRNSKNDFIQMIKSLS